MNFRRRGWRRSLLLLNRCAAFLCVAFQKNWWSWDKLHFICDKYFEFLFHTVMCIHITHIVVYILNPSIVINMPYICAHILRRYAYAYKLMLVSFFLQTIVENYGKFDVVFGLVCAESQSYGRLTVTTSRAWWIKIEEISWTHFQTLYKHTRTHTYTKNANFFSR